MLILTSSLLELLDETEQADELRRFTQDLKAGKLPEKPRVEAAAVAADDRWFFQRWSDSIVAAGKSAMFWDSEKDDKPPEGSAS